MSRRSARRTLRRTAAPAAWFAIAVAAAVGCASAGCGAPPAPRSVVLISVDTLRADRVGALRGGASLTPNLDSFAAQSLQFDTAYAPSSFTLPSVASLLTGRLPEELGIASNRSALGASVPTLASELRRRGFRTGAVVSNFVLRSNSGLAGGFDHYDDALPQREIVRDWPERVAADTTDAALAWLADQPADAPTFLWVHYQDPHGPYTPPPGFRERFLPAERELGDGGRQLPPRTGRGGRGALPSYQEIDGRRDVAFYRAGYDGEIAYLDAELGRLLDALDAPDRRDRTVVVFTADHGEALGEDDYWFAHGERLTDPLVRVPLMIRAAGFAPQRRGDIATLADVTPTLLALVDGDAKAAAAAGRGRDLLAAGADRRDSPVYLATLGGATRARFGWVDGVHKLIVAPDAQRARLYRRDAAGGERRVDDPEVESRLRDRLDAFRAALPRGEAEVRQKLDPADEDRLRALGYAEPDGD